MTTLQPIQLDDHTIIYLETTHVETAIVPVPQSGGEQTRTGQKGIGMGGAGIGSAQIAKTFEGMKDTIKTYTKYTLNAFRDVSLSEVEKVTLEFGISLSGVGGVPYIAMGTAGCNIKVTVECSFPERMPVPPPPPSHLSGIQPNGNGQRPHRPA